MILLARIAARKFSIRPKRGGGTIFADESEGSINVLDDQIGLARSIAFSPDGKLLAAASSGADGLVIIWAVSTDAEN